MNTIYNNSHETTPKDSNATIMAMSPQLARIKVVFSRKRTFTSFYTKKIFFSACQAAKFHVQNSNQIHTFFPNMKNGAEVRPE